jgi:NADH dehydrogenase
VELAGELRGWLCQLEIQNKKCSSKITIVDASSDILWGLHPKVVEAVKKRLQVMGVETIANDPIAVVDKNKVILKSGRRILFDSLIWTGGVKASNLIGKMPMKLTKMGQAEVAGRMECLPQTPDLKLYGKIYGIGDAVCFYDPATGKPVPGLARTALTQARIAAYNIMESIRLKEGLTQKPQYAYYQPLDFSYVIPVGGKWAAAKVGSLVITGFLGWLLKILVELNYLMELLPFWLALKNWFKSVRIIIKNDWTRL